MLTSLRGNLSITLIISAPQPNTTQLSFLHTLSLNLDLRFAAGTMTPETPNYNPYEMLCLQPTGLPASSCRSHENGEKDINKWFIKHIDHITTKRKNEPKELARINALKEFLYQNNHSEVHSRLNQLREKYNNNNSSLSWTCCNPFERAAEKFGVTTATLSKTLGSINLQEAEKNYMWDLSTKLTYEEVLKVFHTCTSIDDRWYKVKVRSGVLVSCIFANVL